MADFDKYSAGYQRELDDCLKLTGRSSDYFAAYKVRYLKRFLQADYQGKILDYGCGIGLLAAHLAKQFPLASIGGYDLSGLSIAKINKELKERGRFTDDISKIDFDYNLIVLSNVLHHISLAERDETIGNLVHRLLPSGMIVIFEHNPFNPLTRKIVDRCVFDKDTNLLAPAETAGYLLNEGMRVSRRDYISFFPGQFRWLRPFEPFLGWLPLGAQYVIAGKKDE